MKAYQLESAQGKVSGVLMNQLGNADGAVGKWELACQHYKQAAEISPELESIANANLALAYCQLQVRRTLHPYLQFTELRVLLASCLYGAPHIATYRRTAAGSHCGSVPGDAAQCWGLGPQIHRRYASRAERPRCNTRRAKHLAQGPRVSGRALRSHCLPVGHRRDGSSRGRVECAAIRTRCVC